MLCRSGVWERRMRPAIAFYLYFHLVCALASGSITSLPRFVRSTWRPKPSSRSGGLIPVQRRSHHGRTHENISSHASGGRSGISRARHKQGACRLPNAERYASVFVIFPPLPATGKGGAAQKLGLKRTTLQNKMRKLNINRVEYVS
jgi:hypothetical protein